MEQQTSNDMRQMTALGRKIESNSFQIIDDEVGDHDWPDHEWQVVRRVIHSTADFEFRDLVAIHRDAIRDGINALKRGAPIIADVKMIDSGLNKARLDAWGVKVHCFISDEDVIAEAKAKNTTRAIEAVKKAHSLGLLDGAIVAVGNAPTSLFETVRHIDDNRAKPSLIVGVPVGFVSAAESKDEVMQRSVPYIVTKGRKGGSTIAVSILHALLYISANEEI